MLSNKKYKNKNLVLVSLILLLLAIVACIGYLYVQRNNSLDNKATPEPTKIDGINYSPPTEEEKKAADEIKQEIVDKEQQQVENSTQNGKIVGNIAITSYDMQEIRAYVSNVIEEGGECTATFTQGETSVQRKSSGFANVSYTQCAPIMPNLPNSDIWEVEIEYVSPKTYGKSNKIELKQ